MSIPRRSIAIALLSFFFVFGASMSGLATVMLVMPGTMLDSLWRFNPQARIGLATLGQFAVFLMLIVCAACMSAAIGLWRCRAWGLWIAVVLLSTNLVGDVLNAAIHHDFRTLIGVPIAAVMLGYLWHKRRVFSPGYLCSCGSSPTK